VLVGLQARGRTDVAAADIERVVSRWVEEGRSSGPWSEGTVRRVAQGLAATLRDFGVLRGAVRKRLVCPHLPVEAFAYVALCLRQRQPSGDRLVGDPEWGLFLLARPAVERLFLEAHQRRLLEYQAAGSVVRVSFPTESIEEYARVIAQGPAEPPRG
jgi:hypothetical protein